MAWKRKEKALSPEEAIAQAKKELAPFWLNSEPLLAAVKTETAASAIPLGSEFSTHPWLFFFIEAGEYSGEGTLLIAREWYRRYHAHRLGVVAVLRATPVGTNGASDVLRKFQIAFPTVIDHDGLLEAAFRIKSWPAVVVQNGPEEVMNIQGKSWAADTEEKIQKMLRGVDAGLALPLPFSLSHRTSEHSRLDFGTRAGTLVESSSLVRLNGNWTQGEDFIQTQDPAANIEISLASPCLSVVARSSLETQPTKIVIELLEEGISEEFLSDSATRDEIGRAIVRVQHVGFYHLLKSLPALRRKAKLSFPDAATIPILIHGLRFGK
jgi:hypothetical protein